METVPVDAVLAAAIGGGIASIIQYLAGFVGFTPSGRVAQGIALVLSLIAGGITTSLVADVKVESLEDLFMLALVSLGAGQIIYNYVVKPDLPSPPPSDGGTIG